MTVEVIGVVLVAIVPALLFLGWLALMATVVAALGATSDIDIDEVTFLRSAARVPDRSCGRLALGITPCAGERRVLGLDGDA